MKPADWSVTESEVRMLRSSSTSAMVTDIRERPSPQPVGFSQARFAALGLGYGPLAFDVTAPLRYGRGMIVPAQGLTASFQGKERDQPGPVVRLAPSGYRYGREASL